jgi:hypothetical protein
LRRFFVFGVPGWFGDRLYSTHDFSGFGVSHMEGMISSGPDIHDDEDASDSDDWSTFALVFFRGL